MQVCPPGLHITLGVFQRLFNLLEEECHCLDQQISVNTCTSSRKSSFEEYLKAKVSLRALKEELTSLINIANQYLVLQLLTTTDPQRNTTVQSTAKDIHDNTNRITVIVCIN